MTDHEAKYRALNTKFHIRWERQSPRLVGVQSAEKLAELYKADEHLNNIPLRVWDSMGASIQAYNRGTAALSQAELVCMCKQAAKDMLLREGLI